MVTLSVIVPTVGRATLARALDSIASQLGPDDEVWVVLEPFEGSREMTPDRRFKFIGRKGDHPGRGSAGRITGMTRATGTHLVFMDDDDVYAPGALDLMRAAACDRPVIFRMDATNVGIGIKWTEPVLRYGNVSTQMFIVPNDPARLGTWAPHDGNNGSDFTFLAGCVQRMGEPVWREEIVAVLRPHPTLTIVTPWHNHLEFADDYLQAIHDAAPDQVIVVDNASEPPLPFDGIRLDDNAGFSRACNAGLAAAETDAVLFLNNDIELMRPGWARPILQALAPGVLVGANLRYDAHANVDGNTFPYLDGWCVAGMRDDLLDLGGFDETYLEPAYFSDNDLCLRARAAGMSLKEVRVGLRHKVNGTSGPPDEPAKVRATEANYLRYAALARELLATV